MAKTNSPAAPAGAPAAAAASTKVNGTPAELPTPGTELGMTPGGAVIKASGVDPNQPKEQVNFKDAGKAFLSTLPDKGAAPPAEKTQAEVIAEGVAASQGAPATGVPGAAADEGGIDELPPEGEIAYDPIAERWRDHTGKFVNAEPPTAEELAAAAPAAGAEGAAAPVKIALPGFADRGEQDLEIEVDDPEIATRLQQLANNGLRRKAFQEEKTRLDGQRAELEAIDQALTVDPVGFMLGRISKERQVEVARALVLEHFDTLLPDLEKFDADPAQRERARVQLRDSMRDSSDRLRTTTESQRRAAACMTAAETIIPDDIDPAIAQAFLRDAERDLIDELRAGRQPTPELVPQLLARRASLYGFEAGTGAPAARSGTGGTGGAPAAGAASTTPAPAITRAAPSAIARPVTDRAKAIADQRATASAAQARIRRVATARRSAARVAPAGVGAAAVSVPIVPPAATVREASKAIRKAGLSQGWTPA